jgi:transketolase
VVVEDHRPEGGIGEAVLSAIATAPHPVFIEHLAVRNLPTSGEPAQLLAEAGIDADHVSSAVDRVLRRVPTERKWSLTR